MHMFTSLVAYDAGNGQIKCKITNETTTLEDGGSPGSMFEALDSICALRQLSLLRFRITAPWLVTIVPSTS